MLLHQFLHCDKVEQFCAAVISFCLYRRALSLNLLSLAHELFAKGRLVSSTHKPLEEVEARGHSQERASNHFARVVLTYVREVVKPALDHN